MELDDLKLHLKQKLDADQPAKTQDEITALLAKNTLSVLGKIKRSLLFEIICCVVFILACLSAVFLANYWYLKVYFGIFTVLLQPFFIVLIYLLRKMKKVYHHTMPVKKNLETLYVLLKEFVKRYFQFTMGLIPFCLIIAMWLGYNDPEREHVSQGFTFVRNSSLLIFLILYVVVLAIIMYFFTKWYLKKLYGNYLEQLKALLKELGDE